MEHMFENLRHRCAEKVEDVPMPFADLTANPPDFVNKQGFKWWKQADLTKWAKCRDTKGISLPEVTGWLVQEPSGRKTYVLLDGTAVEFDSQELEAVAAHIDIMKLVKLDGEQPE